MVDLIVALRQVDGGQMCTYLQYKKKVLNFPERTLSQESPWMIYLNHGLLLNYMFNYVLTSSLTVIIIHYIQ